MNDDYMTYSPELVEEVCDAIESGLSLKDIAGVPPIPDYKILRRYIRENAEFKEAIDDAFCRFCEYLHMENHQIARGVTGYSTGDKERDKLLISSNQWTIERLSKKYNKTHKVELDTKATRAEAEAKLARARAIQAKFEAAGIEVADIIDITPRLPAKTDG